MKELNKWSGIALVNLSIVALLGFVMRSKLLFPLPFIDFKYTLHAHSHFAFGGWVTLALLALMVYQLLPRYIYTKKIYTWLLGGILLNAVGMLISFLYQGYGPVSIGFSTLFIFVTYAFAWVFIKDIRRTQVNKTAKRLSIWAMVYLALSSVGPFTLAYLLATKAPNLLLYKDAIYTYLHLQYSGLFTLAVFALLINKLNIDNKHAKTFSLLLNISVLPSMFISYLWHYPGALINSIAAIGSITLLATAVWFLVMMRFARSSFAEINPTARKIGTIAMIAFVLKMIFQAFTIIPSLGPLVFANRAVIIGFLHLVLLGFISLYILAHFVQDDLLQVKKGSSFALWLFITGIILNEAVLMGQGLGAMFMVSSAVVQWLLWLASICLFAGALLIAGSKFDKPLLKISTSENRKFKPFSQ